MQYLTISIPVRLWHRVDGCVDNSMAVDVVDGVIETVIAGSCVRDAGWRASAAYEGERDAYGWPPPEHPLLITLRREHWQWALLQVNRWESDGQIGAEDDAQVGAIIGDALTTRTAEPH